MCLNYIIIKIKEEICNYKIIFVYSKYGLYKDFINYKSPRFCHC